MGHTTGFSKIPRLGYLYSHNGGGSLATIISSPPTTQILLPQPGDKMSAVATMPATTAEPTDLQADRDVAPSSVYRTFDKEKAAAAAAAKVSSNEQATDWKSQLKSHLANWSAKLTASQADGSAKEATITEEKMMSNLKAIVDTSTKHAAILPKGQRIVNHFSWKPTDDPSALSFGDGVTKEGIESFLSNPTNKTITYIRHGETNCNRLATKEHFLRQYLGRDINYKTDQSVLPKVTITNADRTTETRKLTGLADRYKLISEAALTKKGFAQAEAMGELLRSEFPKADGSEGDPIQHYYISELPRTKETLYAMYGLTPDDHVIGPKEGTVPGTSITYSSLAALNECPSRHGGNPATHRAIHEAISEDSERRGINRIGVVSHGNTLSGLTDNILNTAATNRYHFSNCQADTTAFSTGPLSEGEQSVKKLVDLFLKSIEAETITTASETPAQSAAAASGKDSDDLLSMMATTMPRSSMVSAVGA